MILTGYRPIHDKRGLWFADEDISVLWVKDFMTEKKHRFLANLRDIQSADNMTPDSSDPYYKVREHFNFFNANFKETLGLDHNLS